MLFALLTTTAFAATEEGTAYSGSTDTLNAYVGQKVDAVFLFEKGTSITSYNYTVSFQQDDKDVDKDDVGFSGTVQGRQYVKSNGDTTYSIVEKSEGEYYGVVFTDMNVTAPCTVSLTVTMTVNDVKLLVPIRSSMRTRPAPRRAI